MTDTRRIDWQAAMRYPFEDRRWPFKAGILALLALIPVLNFAVVGYEVETARRVARGQTPPLPEWDDLASLFRDGLWLALARYVYNLPVFAIVAGVVVAAIAALAGTSQSEPDIPLVLIVAILAGGFALTVMVSLLIGAIAPAVTLQYARHRTFAACFDFAAIVKNIRRRPSAYLTVVAAYAAMALGLSVVVVPVSMTLSFVPCLGPLAQILLTMALIAFLFLALAHLQGQLLRALE